MRKPGAKQNITVYNFLARFLRGTEKKRSAGNKKSEQAFRRDYRQLAMIRSFSSEVMRYDECFLTLILGVFSQPMQICNVLAEQFLWRSVYYFAWYNLIASYV